MRKRGSMPNAGEAVVEVLAEAGVRRFYTVPGESFLEVLDTVERRTDLALVSTRHESGASFMAEADAKHTGVPAVVLATRGVGASNAAIGVHTAMQDSTPMVVLLGHVETEWLYREAFQEVDLAAFYAPITKWSATATRADRLPELVHRALRIATTGRPGPVMISLPADILSEELSGDYPPVPLSPAPDPSEADLKRVAERLRAASRPVIIAGGGARRSREELVSVAERYGAGVYAAFRRQDVFPNDHPLYLGHLALGAPLGTLEALKDANLVLVAGCRLSEVTTQSYTLPASGTEVLQIDIDPASIGATVPVSFGLVADCKKALAGLVRHAPPELPGSSRRDWRAGHAAYLESSTVGESRSRKGVDPAHVVAAMNGAFGEDTMITNGAGNFATYLHRYRRYNRPFTQLAPANGAMGYAVPAAVAAKLAEPEREVVAVSGDGDFLMTGQEIETAVRCGAHIKVVVLRNGMHGTIAMHQARAFGRVAATEIGEVDLAAFARSLGADGILVSAPDELASAMERAAATEGVVLVDVVTDPELISPTATMSGLLAAGMKLP
jgi:acetolactate synthase-1/2/3 large subunit